MCVCVCVCVCVRERDKMFMLNILLGGGRGGEGRGGEERGGKGRRGEGRGRTFVEGTESWLACSAAGWRRGSLRPGRWPGPSGETAVCCLCPWPSCCGAALASVARAPRTTVSEQLGAECRG